MKNETKEDIRNFGFLMSSIGVGFASLGFIGEGGFNNKGLAFYNPPPLIQRVEIIDQNVSLIEDYRDNLTRYSLFVDTLPPYKSNIANLIKTESEKKILLLKNQRDSLTALLEYNVVRNKHEFDYNKQRKINLSIGIPMLIMGLAGYGYLGSRIKF